MKKSIFKEGENFYRKLGPGMITGASDDDPSGILTYLQSGVILGFGSLWMVIITLPLMYVIQEMCGRIGLVSDKGLIKLIKENYSKPTLYIIALISIAAIVVNIAADILAGGIIIEKFTGIDRIFWLPVLGVIILLSMMFLSYQKFVRIMKWLAYSLFFYVLAVFYIKVDWWGAIGATFTPNLVFSRESIVLLTAILGTTISPYLFFWQANEEVEQRDEEMKIKSLKRFLVTKHELKFLKEDTFLGMAISNLVMWFIIVGASYMGVSQITTFEEASLALEPLLGPSAFLAFSVGIIGTALLTIPVLAGGVGYILSEIFEWREGMNKTFREAKGFYLVIAFSIFVSILINFLNFDPISLLIYAAVFYALITPPLIFIILQLANNKKVMHEKINSLFSNILGVAAFIITLAAAATYVLISWIK